MIADYFLSRYNCPSSVSGPRATILVSEPETCADSWRLIAPTKPPAPKVTVSLSSTFRGTSRDLALLAIRRRRPGDRDRARRPIQHPYSPVLEPYTPNNFLLTIDGVTFLFDDPESAKYLRTR